MAIQASTALGARRPVWSRPLVTLFAFLLSSPVSAAPFYVDYTFTNSETVIVGAATFIGGARSIGSAATIQPAFSLPLRVSISDDRTLAFFDEFSLSYLGSVTTSGAFDLGLNGTASYSTTLTRITFSSGPVIADLRPDSSFDLRTQGISLVYSGSASINDAAAPFLYEKPGDYFSASLVMSGKFVASSNFSAVSLQLAISVEGSGVSAGTGSDFVRVTVPIDPGATVSGQHLSLEVGGGFRIKETVSGTPVFVPEPASALLLAGGLVGLAGRSRRSARSGVSH